MSESDKLLAMKLHEKTNFTDYGQITITRVIGGWIYEMAREVMSNDGTGVMTNTTRITAVFVPQPFYLTENQKEELQAVIG